MWQDPDNSLYFNANDDKLEFDNRYNLGNANDNYSGALFLRGQCFYSKATLFKKIKRNREKLEAGLISQESFEQSLQSYFGILKHCRGYKIKQKIDKLIAKRP